MSLIMEWDNVITDLLNVQGLIQLVRNNDVENLKDRLVTLLDNWEENGDDRDVLSLPLFDDLPLLPFACCQEDISVEVVTMLIANGCNVNHPSKHGTPIQIIATNGNSHLVDILLDHGAMLETEVDPVFSENSPFYLASLYGQTDVVRQLLSYQPSMSAFNFTQVMVKDDGVRRCLLHAACLGGNLELVKLWLSPAMDINQPLEDCENDTPMYAACSGHHEQVAKFLHEIGAEITSTIITKFPDIVGHIVENCITFRDEDMCDNDQEPGHIGKYRKLNLGRFHFSWMANVQKTCVELDLQHNNLTTLPSEIPWYLPNLLVLNASHNKLPTLLSPQGSLQCVRLLELHLTNNNLHDVCHEVFQLPSLVTLNLSQNKLKYLLRTRHQQFTEVTPFGNKDDTSFMQCPNLSYLNVSNNILEMLPQDYIRKCSGLTSLDVSHNQLVSFPNAWDCNMGNLNLSHNNLDRCPVSLEQYWCGTLRVLYLNDNHVEEINESVLKLGSLIELYAANNIICRLPHPDHWECSQLYLLDLSHNSLGSKPINRNRHSVRKNGDSFRKNRDSFRKWIPAVFHSKLPEGENFSFPSFLENCLDELNLSHNNLNQVPLSVSNLALLHCLDISHNPAITTLPKELGRLKDNCIIKMNGLTLTHIPKGEQQCSKQTIIYLRNELRQSKNYYKLKVVILGKKDKGKTTLAGKLKGQTLGNHRELGVQRHDIELAPKGSNFIPFNKKDQPISLSVWDLSGDQTLAATHHCFFTPNSLYILVWDIWSVDEELDNIGQYLYSIQARMPSMPNSSILLVGTFLDKNTLSTKQKEVDEIKQKLIDRYGPDGDSACGLSSRLDWDRIIPVSCTTDEGIQELKEKLYDLAIKLPDPNNRPNTFIGRSIPKSYISLETSIKKTLKDKTEQKKQPFLDHEEFTEMINKIPDNDIDSADEVTQVIKFLTETGTMLHFNDQLKGLNNLYFLDPTWLCDVLSKVLKYVERHVRGGKISMTEVKRLFHEDDKFPDDYIEQYIQLMERFGIALSVDFGRMLFIPSQLSKYPAIELNKSEQQELKVIRLYKMAFIPTGFWSRLLSRLMYRIELLTTDWILKNTMTSSITPAKFQKKLERNKSSSSGLQIVKKDVIYWEDGLYLGHESGYLVVESTLVPQAKDLAPHSGVLITVQSTKGDYSIMGIVVDEIDDLLNDHYPGLMECDEFGQARVQRYALCPMCYNTNNSIPPGLDHFSVEHCARLIMSSEYITCPKNLKIPLIQLVPELLMQEIPKKFILDISKLTIDVDKLLGIGVAGKVLKGCYGDVDVAVKLYHGAPQITDAMIQQCSIDKGYHTQEYRCDKEEDSIYKNYSAYTIDSDEANSMKAWNAFMEMRQEVLVTSKLHHPYIVSFLGISVRPTLLICLEYAPHGSLRTTIDDAIIHREPFNKYRDKDKIFPAVFDKEMTYKILFQIASGLEYLHKQGIIYRDLKSDNILVFSLDLNSSVNVKLSDYGISRFCSSGGTVGLVGTPGYQAPEIINGQSYDEKVDIYSFSMVTYEILSGRRPFEEYRNLAQISKAIRTESKRPCMQEYNVDPNCHCIEDLMKQCWNKSADKRPSAEDIVSALYMRSVKFMAFKKMYKLPCGLKDKGVDCISFTNSQKMETIWMWEGSDENRNYTTLDKYTTHDAKGCVPAGDSMPGSKVTCMCHVDKDIWIGTEGFKIETFNQQCFVKKEKKPSCVFQTPYAVPTCIIYIKEHSQEGKKVYVTLDTGKVMIFEPVSKIITRRTIQTSETLCGWRNTKTLTVGETSATCCVYVPPSGQTRNEIWIDCGDSICVVSDSTCMVEGRIKLQQYLKRPIKNMARMVQSLVYSSDRVWCLISDTPNVIEIDVDKRLPTYILTMDEFYPSGFTVCEYITFEQNDMVSQVLQHIGQGGNLVAPPVPPRSSIRIPSSEPETFSLGIDSPVKVCSMVHVGDTLWVGRNCGDILIINVGQRNSFQYCEVIAILKVSSSAPDLGKDVNVLLSTGNSVVSFSQTGSRKGEVMTWEPYTSQDVQRIQSYWSWRKRTKDPPDPIDEDI